MIAIPVSGAAVRRTLRSIVVVAIAVTALTFALPDSLMITTGDGEPAIYTAANVVAYAYPRALAAGVSV